MILLSHRLWLIRLGLFAIVMLVFFPLAFSEFLVFDDPYYVTNNPRVLSGLGIDNTIWAFSTIYFGYYYPLTWLSHMLDCQLFGTWAGGHHLMSVIIHALNSLLLLEVLRRFTGALAESAFVSALFAVHPMHVESVAWIAERKDVLSTLFFFLCLLAYLGYCRRRSLAALAGTLLLFLLSLLAKPMFVTLPALLLLLDFWPLNRISAPQISTATDHQPGEALPHVSPGVLLLEKLPFIALSAIFSVVTFFSQRTAGAVSGLDLIPFGSRVTNALGSIFIYIFKMFAPIGLTVFYPLPKRGLSLPATLALAFFVILLTFFSLFYARKRPYLAMGWLWFLIVLSPVLGIVQVGGQAYADRYTYVSYIGLFIALTWWVTGFTRGTSGMKRAAALSAIAILGLFAIGSSKQVRYWKDGIRLFEHAVRVTENNHIAYNLLGLTQMKKGDLASAERSFTGSLRCFSGYPEAFSNLGCIYLMTGRLTEARNLFQKLAVSDPENCKALYNWGCAAAEGGDLTEAEGCFERALALKPDFWEAHIRLSAILLEKGDFHRSRMHTERATAIAPCAQSFLGAGIFKEKAGDLEGAVRELRKAAGYEPRNPDVNDALARCIAKKGGTISRVDLSEATIAAGFACAGGKTSGLESLVDLARARMSAGDDGGAMEILELIYPLARGCSNPTVADEIAVLVYRARRDGNGSKGVR